MIKLPFPPYSDKLVGVFKEDILKNSEVNWKPTFRGNKNYGIHATFKDWLFEQGIILQSDNKKLYLMFLSEQDAIMFALKWGVYENH